MIAHSVLCCIDTAAAARAAKQIHLMNCPRHDYEDDLCIEGASQAQEGQDTEAAKPSSSFDSMSHSMDIGNSDTESPDPPVAPADPVWSPQYSPAKLAELIPVNPPSDLNTQLPTGSNAIPLTLRRDAVPDRSDNVHHSHGYTHELGVRQSQVAPQMGVEQQLEQGNHTMIASGMPAHRAMQPQKLIPHHGADPVHPQSPHSGPMALHHAPRPPSPLRQASGLESMLHHAQQQAGRPLAEQHMGISHQQHGGQLQEVPMQSAPGDISHQSEQQLQQSAYTPIRQEHAPHPWHGHMQPYVDPQIEHGALRQVGPPVEGELYNPEVPYMHNDHAVHQAHGHGHQGAAHCQAPGQQGVAQVQGDYSHPFRAIDAKSLHHLPNEEQMLHGQRRTVSPSSAAPNPYMRSHKGTDQVLALPPALQPVQHHAQFSHLPPQSSSSATVLSPELSAALAAGMLGQSLPSSHHRPPQREQQHQHGQHEVHLQAGPPDSRNVPPALPPELSAALASGQLSLQLGGSGGAVSVQQAAYQPQQAAHQPEQPAHRYEQARRGPKQAVERSAFQPQQAALGPVQAALHSATGRQDSHSPHARLGPVAELGMQVPSTKHPSGLVECQAQPWQQPLHAERYGPAAPMHMTMNSPSLQTNWPAASAHPETATEPPLLSMMPAQFEADQHPQQEPQHAQHGFQPASHAPQHAKHDHLQMQHGSLRPQLAPHDPQRAQHDHQQPWHGPQHPQHGPQHAQRGPQHPQHGPQHPERGPQHAQHAPQHAKHGPQYAQRGPQHALQHAPHDMQQVQHDPQHAQHSPQRMQVDSQHAQHDMYQGYQGPHLHCPALQPSQYASQIRPVDSPARSDQVLQQRPQHELNAPAVHAEHSSRRQRAQPDHYSEHEWQARKADDGTEQSLVLASGSPKYMHSFAWLLVCTLSKPSCLTVPCKTHILLQTRLGLHLHIWRHLSY